MKYPEFQQIIDTMDAAAYDYKKEVVNIEKRRIDVANGMKISLEEHIKAMVYSLLSDQRVWNDLVPHMSQIDSFFANYNVSALKNINPDELVKNITSIKCGNMKIRKQMNSLKNNIAQLEQIELDYDSVDKYYHSTDKVALVKSLSEGTYKLNWMGVALVCEYLKGVGVNTIKPDSLLMRLLNRLGYAKKATDCWEAIRICEDIAQEYGLSMPMVDTILWQYCARGKFEICTDDPKCSLCGVKNCPSRK